MRDKKTEKRKQQTYNFQSKMGMVSEKLSGYVMVLPAMLFLMVFTFYPMINLGYLSFFSWDMLSDKIFVGLDNYKKLLFYDINFKMALKNTAIYTVYVVVVVLILGLIFACWMQKSSKINAIAQRIMFFPHICSTVAISMVFQWLLDEEGLVNAILKFFNLPAFDWLNDSATALGAVIFVTLWKNAGYYALILLSALKAIPTEINEAAELDNAKPWRTFFKITLPMVSPQLFFLLITITIGSFKVFESIRVLTQGGPGRATDVLVYFIYRNVQELQVGYAAAAGSVLMIILIILTIFYFRCLGRKVHYQ